MSENWKKVQENTFTKWVNNCLKGHLTTTKQRVMSLQTDLEDGTILAELLENIAKTRFHHVTEARMLRFKPQKQENLGYSFKFMEQEKIKLVNIGES